MPKHNKSSKTKHAQIVTNTGAKKPLLDIKGKSSMSDITWWHQIKTYIRAKFEDVADILDTFEVKKFIRKELPSYPEPIPYIKREEIGRAHV